MRSPKRGRKPRPVRRIGEVKPPRGLSAAEKREFLRLIEAMRERGTLEKADVRLVEAAARCAVLLARAYRQVPTGALVIVAGNGMECAHPIIGVINVQTQRLRNLMHDLGLSTAGRIRGGAV